MRGHRDAQVEFLPDQQTWDPGCPEVCRGLGDKGTPGPSDQRHQLLLQGLPKTIGYRPPTGTCGGSSMWDSEDLSMKDTPQARRYEGPGPGGMDRGDT